jgi:hypothetical protein
MQVTGPDVRNNNDDVALFRPQAVDKNITLKPLTNDHSLIRNFFDETFSFRFGNVKV